MSLPIVFLDVSIDGKLLGRIEITLRSDIAPKTAENFRMLCTGEKSTPQNNLWYKGCVFHRIIPGFMAQGGDLTRNTAGVGNYGEKFADENFILKHTGPGILSMANRGPDTNGSSFFLCFEACSWLDGKHCVFGSVTAGLEILKAIEAVGSESGDTSKLVKIESSGQLA